jgi:hypothetical protein
MDGEMGFEVRPEGGAEFCFGLPMATAGEDAVVGRRTLAA